MRGYVDAGRRGRNDLPKGGKERVGRERPCSALGREGNPTNKPLLREKKSSGEKGESKIPTGRDPLFVRNADIRDVIPLHNARKGGEKIIPSETGKDVNERQPSISPSERRRRVLKKIEGDVT